MLSKVCVWLVFLASDASHFPELIIPFPKLQGYQIRHTLHIRPRPIGKLGIPSALSSINQ